MTKGSTFILNVLFFFATCVLCKFIELQDVSNILHCFKNLVIMYISS